MEKNLNTNREWRGKVCLGYVPVKMLYKCLIQK